MRVKLIATTPNPIDVMWTAARTCYSAKSPAEMWDEIYYPSEEWQKLNDENYKQQIDKHLKLVKAVLDSGHMSIAEHVNYTFAIEGISRACSHQLVRHRLCTFSQQSQRYVEIKEYIDVISGWLHQAMDGPGVEAQEEAEKELMKICEQYFVDVNECNIVQYAHCVYWYLKHTQQGAKAEDARNLLPNATKTNIVVTTNLRNLIHISELRLCTRAQKEIRQLFKLIKEEVTNNNEVLGNMLMAQCDRLGYCPEASKCCGKRPTLQDNLLSKADWEQLMNACDDPQVNEKIIKLMKMKPAF